MYLLERNQKQDMRKKDIPLKASFARTQLLQDARGTVWDIICVRPTNRRRQTSEDAIAQRHTTRRLLRRPKGALRQRPVVKLLYFCSYNFFKHLKERLVVICIKLYWG